MLWPNGKIRLPPSHPSWTNSDYSGVSEAMRSASIARTDAKTDRASAATDLANLADRNHDRGHDSAG
jgi:hypothetical protein